MPDFLTKGAAEELLELPQRYTKEDLKKAYTALARVYHPDAAKRQGIDVEEASRIMADANRAYDGLKHQFDEYPDRVISRDEPGITTGFAGVDWREENDSDDPWDFVDEWTTHKSKPKSRPVATKQYIDDPSKHLVRRFLLGPIVIRVLVTAALFLWWWRTFPFLPQNAVVKPYEYWKFSDLAIVVPRAVWPTYLLALELATGHISLMIREVLSGLVSYITGVYVDIRPKSASYGCALYKFLNEQIWAFVLLPLVIIFAVNALDATNIFFRVLFGALTVITGIDLVASLMHAGIAVTVSLDLAEYIERRYLMTRRALLEHCGVWEA